jgi:hypothetical protein
VRFRLIDGIIVHMHQPQSYRVNLAHPSEPHSRPGSAAHACRAASLPTPDILFAVQSLRTQDRLHVRSRLGYSSLQKRLLSCLSR